MVLRSFRVGMGTDVHRLEPGDGLKIGGVAIPCGYRSIADSDGDVLLHAIVDALLGACGAGDIGDHFPASAVSPGEDSACFVEHAVGVVAARGGRIVNVDCVIDIEVCRLGPFKQRIRTRLAEVLGVDASRVNVKAKTAEGLGAVGEGRAFSAQAVVLVEI